tara:strand:- start:563 stop:1285 length:723 start_codon:yes stop_codon:yes gene_type:complete
MAENEINPILQDLTTDLPGLPRVNSEPLMRVLVSLAMDEELQDFMPDASTFDGPDWDNVVGDSGGLGWDLGFGADETEDMLSTNPIVVNIKDEINGKKNSRSGNTSSSSSSSSTNSYSSAFVGKAKKKPKTTRRIKKEPKTSTGDAEKDVDIRLKRNRESAKQYRIRKKAEVGVLQDTLTTLEQRNEQLRRQVAQAQAQRQMVNVQNIEEFNKRMVSKIDIYIEANKKSQAHLKKLSKTF